MQDREKAIDREVRRKAQNRARKKREHLDSARHEPPEPYVRRIRVRPEWHGVDVPPRQNRAHRRGFALSRLGNVMPEAKAQKCRAARRQARRHRRLMASR
jgi:hypothetical protein